MSIEELSQEKDSQSELQEKQQQAIVEIKEEESIKGLEDKAVKVGLIQRIGEIYEGVLKKPTQEFTSILKDNAGTYVKAGASLFASMVPIAGSATSGASVAARGVDEAVELGVKTATKEADEAVGILAKLAISEKGKAGLKKAMKAIDPTPDVPLWLTTAAGTAGAAGVPYVDMAPEALQLAIVAGRVYKGLAKWGFKVGGNAKEYIKNRVNKVAEKKVQD